MNPQKNKMKHSAIVASRDPQVKAGLFTKQRKVLSLSSQQFEKLMRSVLDKGASFRFQGKGFSMSPFIKDGDVLTIVPLQGRPRFGDVVVFTHPTTAKLIIHRIIGKKGDTYRTKGDNVQDEDGMITKETIAGRVINVERHGKCTSLGIGLDRFIIAFVTRNGLLPLLNPIWLFVRFFIRRRSVE